MKSVFDEIKELILNKKYDNDGDIIILVSEQKEFFDRLKALLTIQKLNKWLRDNQ